MQRTPHPTLHDTPGSLSMIGGRYAMHENGNEAAPNRLSGQTVRARARTEERRQSKSRTYKTQTGSEWKRRDFIDGHQFLGSVDVVLGRHNARLTDLVATDQQSSRPRSAIKRGEVYRWRQPTRVPSACVRPLGTSLPLKRRDPPPRPSWLGADSAPRKRKIVP
jgi:hypothetical protein